MKQDWIPEELIETFSMTSEEVTWVSGATPHNVLGKAVLLKVFQHQGRFPEDIREIPDEVVAYIAQQVGMPEIVFSDYQWAGRTAERHRQTIREHLGFHQCTTAEVDDLGRWGQGVENPRDFSRGMNRTPWNCNTYPQKTVVDVVFKG